MKKGKKFGNVQVGKFKSKLERYAAQALKKARIEFEYEPISFQLWEGGIFPESFERSGKKMRRLKKVQGISYTPDFVGRDWIIETKGKRTEEFNIRWKLFKQYMQDQKMSHYLFLPTTHKEVDICIKEILEKKLH